MSCPDSRNDVYAPSALHCPLPRGPVVGIDHPVDPEPAKFRSRVAASVRRLSLVLDDVREDHFRTSRSEGTIPVGLLPLMC